MTGATTALRCAAIHASRYAAFACSTAGLSSTACRRPSACAELRLAHRLRQRGARQIDAFLRVPHFFRGDGMIGHQRFALGQIGLGARQLQFSRLDCRIELIRRRFLLAHLAHGLRQRVGRAAQAGLRIDGIEPTSTCPAFTSCVSSASTAITVPETCAEITTLIAVHIGIVGLLALRQHQHPIHRPQRAEVMKITAMMSRILRRLPFAGLVAGDAV